MRKWVLLVFFFFLLFVKNVAAADDFKTDYLVDYYVTLQDEQISTRVNFSTKITNLQKDLYVDQFALSFPASFKISTITASDDHGAVEPQVTIDEEKTSIKLQLNDPQVGQNTTNTLNLSFYQEKLFRQNGNLWEVILPTISKREHGTYSVRIHLPSTDKKIAIAKPAPTRIEGDTIYWENPAVKTLYAVFGDKQFYAMDLSYHLANEKNTPVYTEVAFPPDTVYQQIFVDRINPQPHSVRIDDDGNYLARYDLKPKQEIDVRFIGYAQIFSQPREELIEVTRQRFAMQKPYLLKQHQYWTLSDKASYQHLNTAQAIYKSLVGSFSYDYDRLLSNKSYRLGAEQALKNPTKAVCVEFTDSFVALARAAGIYAREIQGYGFSQDERLRPLSLISDVLHSWPEYYDEDAGIWKQIDPTWENTSGIDYFSSFDLDHIAFAIHGKDPEDPPPAGTYKYEDSQDVSIKVTESLPAEKISLTAQNLKVPKSVSDKQVNNGSVEIVNRGNVTAYNVPVKLQSEGFVMSAKEVQINQLPPYGSQVITFTFKPSGSTSRQGSITVLAGDDSAISQAIRITPLIQTITIVVGVFVLITLLLMIIFLHKHQRQRKLSGGV